MEIHGASIEREAIGKKSLSEQWLRPEGCQTLSVEEAAEILGISRASAYAAAKRREIPTIRIGRRLLVPIGSFERMLTETGEEQ
jgi:excisionase family DNA binding protein